MRIRQRLWSLFAAPALAFSWVLCAPIITANAFCIIRPSNLLIAKNSFGMQRIRQGTLCFAQQEDPNEGSKETQDQRLNRLLRERIEELDMTTVDYDDTNDETPSSAEQRESLFPQFRIGSIEVLALIVSAFFVATASLSNGALFATPPPTATTRTRIVLDADEILRHDFARDSSSVNFGVEEKQSVE